MIVKNRSRVGGGVSIYYRSVLNVMNRQDLIPANMLKLFVSKSPGQNPNQF
jgi:hypothetical protein